MKKLLIILTILFASGICYAETIYKLETVSEQDVIKKTLDPQIIELGTKAEAIKNLDSIIAKYNQIIVMYTQKKAEAEAEKAIISGLKK